MKHLMDFLDRDFNENGEDGDNGQHLLHQAVHNGHISLLLEMTWKDPSLLELQNEEGLTPLAIATQSQQLPIIKQLVKMGADINTQDKSGRTPLSSAAYQGWYEGVLFLIRRGAKQMILDKSGRTPLHASTYHENTSTMTALLQTLSIGDINKPDNELMTALHWAAFHTRPRHLEELLQSGADYFAQDIDGKTPLHWAAQNGSVECCKMLASCPDGVLIINSEDLSGKTPVHFASAAGYAEVIKLFNSFPGCNLEPKDPDNRTPLHWAAAMGMAECMSVLVSLNVDLSPVDSDGGTPLDYTKQSGHTECQKLLEQKLGLNSTVNEAEVNKISTGSNNSTPTKTKRGPLSFIKDLFITRKTESDIELTQNRHNTVCNITNPQIVTSSSSTTTNTSIPVSSASFISDSVPSHDADDSLTSPDITLFLSKPVETVNPRTFTLKPLPDINTEISNQKQLDVITENMADRATTPNSPRKSSKKREKLGPLRGVTGRGMLPHERIAAIKHEDHGQRSPTPPAELNDKFLKFSNREFKSQERRHTLHSVDSNKLALFDSTRNCVSSCEEPSYSPVNLSPRPSTRPRCDKVLNNDRQSSLDVSSDDEIDKTNGLTLPERKLLDRKIQSVLY